MAEGIFIIVLHQIGVVGLLHLSAFLVFSSHLESDAINLEIGNFRSCHFVGFLHPGKEHGLANRALVGLHIGNGVCNVAIVEVEFLHLLQDGIAGAFCP